MEDRFLIRFWGKSSLARLTPLRSIKIRKGCSERTFGPRLEVLETWEDETRWCSDRGRWDAWDGYIFCWWALLFVCLRCDAGGILKERRWPLEWFWLSRSFWLVLDWEEWENPDRAVGYFLLVLPVLLWVFLELFLLGIAQCRYEGDSFDPNPEDEEEIPSNWRRGMAPVKDNDDPLLRFADIFLGMVEEEEEFLFPFPDEPGGYLRGMIIDWEEGLLLDLRRGIEPSNEGWCWCWCWCGCWSGGGTDFFGILQESDLSIFFLLGSMMLIFLWGTLNYYQLLPWVVTLITRRFPQQ